MGYSILKALLFDFIAGENKGFHTFPKVIGLIVALIELELTMTLQYRTLATRLRVTPLLSSGVSELI